MVSVEITKIALTCLLDPDKKQGYFKKGNTNIKIKFWGI